MQYLPHDGAQSYIHRREGVFITSDFVLAVELRGVVTQVEITRLAKHIQRCGAYMLAFVVLMDKAVFTAGKAYLDAIDPNLLSRLPGAIVVNEASIPGVAAYARRIAEHGILRAGFTGRNEAFAWAARQAQVHEAQAAWVRRTSTESAS